MLTRKKIRVSYQHYLAVLVTWARNKQEMTTLINERNIKSEYSRRRRRLTAASQAPRER